MCSDISTGNAIEVASLGKCYQMYGRPQDRLKQMLLPRVKRLLGMSLGVSCHEFWALKDVSFDIKCGETVGVIGRNGSGKSTLLQMICGTLNPTAGTIKTNGRVAALLELGSGFNPEFSGRENVHLNGAILGLSSAEIERRFDEIAAFAELNEFIDQPVKTYSSGMVVRLAFAVAINVDPDILIVDEALSVGDELFQRKCFSRIENMRADGTTILFVSHSGSTIVELCDRVILLDGGEHLASGQPKQIVGRYQKLLYAPADKRDSIRKKIRQETLVEVTGSVSQGDVGRVTTNVAESGAPIPIELRDSYDPGLKPTSTIPYESYGAFIQDPSIYTLDGLRVNNLTRGKKYRYRYRVRFSVPAEYVKFGMLIKTTTGLELGGGTSAISKRKSLARVKAGSEVIVQFEFLCMLNTGVYFLNAGVLGDLNGSETFLHRLVDAEMFRVLSETDSLVTGIVDFCCKPDTKILEIQ